MNIAPLHLAGALTLMISCAATATETTATVHLQQAAHVCNDEEETKRLAENDHLREMAKALVEFKATKYCFIMQASQMVRLLEHRGNYIKFSHENKVLYTFSEDIRQQL